MAGPIVENVIIHIDKDLMIKIVEYKNARRAMASEYIRNGELRDLVMEITGMEAKIGRMFLDKIMY